MKIGKWFRQRFKRWSGIGNFNSTNGGTSQKIFHHWLSSSQWNVLPSSLHNLSHLPPYFLRYLRKFTTTGTTTRVFSFSFRVASKRETWNKAGFKSFILCSRFVSSPILKFYKNKFSSPSFPSSLGVVDLLGITEGRTFMVPCNKGTLKKEREMQ